MIILNRSLVFDKVSLFDSRLMDKNLHDMLRISLLFYVHGNPAGSSAAFQAGFDSNDSLNCSLVTTFLGLAVRFPSDGQKLT